MVDILRNPDLVKIFCDEENFDTKVDFETEGRKLKVFVTANESHPRMICLRWNYKTEQPVITPQPTLSLPLFTIKYQGINVSPLSECQVISP